MKFISQSEAETLQFGRELAQKLKPGDVLALMGHLGSGKTCLTRGICEGLHVTDIVTSPTFVLINEYRGSLPVYHFDFYRLNSEDEIRDLGVDDYFYGDGVCIIEWAERGLSLIPPDRVEVHLKGSFDSAQENIRHIEIIGNRFELS